MATKKTIVNTPGVQNPVDAFYFYMQDTFD